MPPRVAFVTLELAPGAIIKGNSRLARRLLAHGIEVDFVGLQGPNSICSSDVPAGVRLLSLECRRHRHAISALMRYMAAATPDVILISSYLHGLSAVAARKLVGAKPRIVVRSHEIASLYLHSRRSFFDRQLLKYAMRYFYRYIDQVVAVSKPASRDLEALLAWPAGRVTRLPDAILDDQIKAMLKVDPGHNWLQSPNSDTIVSIGRLESEKDHRTLLRAFREVRQYWPGKLLILGQGTLRQTLQEYATSLDLQDYVDFVGHVDNPYSYLARSRALVLTSTREGLGNVVVEALACGCPVVATRSGGPEEIITNDEFGSLVPVGNASEIARGILHVIGRTYSREAMQLRARDYHINSVWPSFLEVCDLRDYQKERHNKW